MVRKKEKGIIMIVFILLCLAVVFIALDTLVFVSSRENFLANNEIKSARAYYIAESGIEDVLLRLKSEPSLSGFSYSQSISGGIADISISENVGGSKTIISQGSYADAIKKIRVVFKVSDSQIGFHYGAQVGDGGIEMGNNSRIKGNLFSNGNVIGLSGAMIDNSVIVAGSNKISDVAVGDDALAYMCEDSEIGGKLTYVSSKGNCSAGSFEVRTEPIAKEDLPISSEQISEWKSATSVNIIENDVLISGSNNYLGPAQIGTVASPKNLTVGSNSRLKMTGTVFVTGNIIFNNNAIIELDSSYGTLSGVMMADGRIATGNNVVLSGSGHAGSYLLLLSTNNSLNPSNPALSVSNNAQGAIFYASNGLLYLGNNMKAREITGYKIKTNNNVVIEYDSGLEQAIFSSGPGASWQIEEWREIQ